MVGNSKETTVELEPDDVEYFLIRVFDAAVGELFMFLESVRAIEANHTIVECYS